MKKGQVFDVFRDGKPTVRVVASWDDEAHELIAGMPVVFDPVNEMGEVLIEDIFAPGNKIEFLQAQIKALSEEERMEVINRFCQFCGDDDPTCQCWNDE